MLENSLNLSVFNGNNDEYYNVFLLESLLSLKKSKLLQLLENEEETLCDSLARDEPSCALSCEDKNERVWS